MTYWVIEELNLIMVIDILMLFQTTAWLPQEWIGQVILWMNHYVNEKKSDSITKQAKKKRRLGRP